MPRNRLSQFDPGHGREQGGHRKWQRVDGHNATILLSAVWPSGEVLEHRPEGGKGGSLYGHPGRDHPGRGIGS